MANAFEEAFGIPLPKCCNLGECCKGASPSKPFHQLMARAATGDVFARNFFSIMEPYPSQADAEKVVPGLVNRMREAAKKLPDFGDPDELVFYHCRYLLPDNRCGVHEDRPQFCRDYPDTPYVVTAPGCAYEGWVNACKQKYQNLQTELADAKAMKAEVEALKRQINAINPLTGESPVFSSPPLLTLGSLPIVYLPRLMVGSLLGNIQLYRCN